MELINATRMQAGYTLAVDPRGQELLVVAIKGTFVLPAPGEPVRLADEQRPLTLADTFSGEPGESAPLHEVDFAPRKTACDVLLIGSAYAPEGREVTRCGVGLRVGTMTKAFHVVGDRVWDAGAGTIRPSDPQAFTRMPISYDVAFGGTDRESDDPADHDAYRANPVGRGYRKHLKRAWVDGRPLPNTEESGAPVAWPGNAYRPMAFGPLGRAWSARARFAGTYDDAWLADVFPFLPADFDDRYFQAAPVDQQIALPRGTLEVALSNLTPDGLRQFSLPFFEAPIVVFPRRGGREDLKATLDTLVLEPDAGCLTMTWRVARPLRKNLHELLQVLVGRKGREWWQKREEVAFPIPVVMVPIEQGS